jgi:hypothetical protein
MTKKQTVSTWLSRYIRLRDCNKDQIGICCTCGKRENAKYMDAGHYISRGKGGASGVYFDQRNVHVQCKACNKWGGTQAHDKYTEFMLKKYGQKVIDELNLKDKTNTYKAKDFIGFKLYYQQEVARLLKEKGLKAWW